MSKHAIDVVGYSFGRRPFDDYYLSHVGCVCISGVYRSRCGRSINWKCCTWGLYNWCPLVHSLRLCVSVEMVLGSFVLIVHGQDLAWFWQWNAIMNATTIWCRLTCKLRYAFFLPYHKMLSFWTTLLKYGPRMSFGSHWDRLGAYWIW